MNWQVNRIKSAIDGTNPMIVKELKGSLVAFSDTQFLPGYCVLLPKREVNSLNDLYFIERQEFLMDMSLVGDTILKVCSPLRINYDILGNTDNFLHAHIFPRYIWEAENIRKMPVWLYDKFMWIENEYQYSVEKHGEIRVKILEYLNENYQLSE